jgi:hypothetical protein
MVITHQLVGIDNELFTPQIYIIILKFQQKSYFSENKNIAA